MRNLLKKVVGAVAAAAAVITAGVTIAIDLLTLPFRRNHKTMDTMYEQNLVPASSYFQAKVAGMATGFAAAALVAVLAGPVTGLLLGFLAHSYAGTWASRQVIGAKAYDRTSDEIFVYGDFAPLPVTTAVVTAVARAAGVQLVDGTVAA